jgi:hypothetical protein
MNVAGDGRVRDVGEGFVFLEGQAAGVASAPNPALSAVPAPAGAASGLSLDPKAT